MPEDRKVAAGWVLLIVLLFVLGWILLGTPGCGTSSDPAQEQRTGEPHAATRTPAPGGDYVLPSNVPVDPPESTFNTPETVPAGPLDVASKYITAQENRDSYYRDNPRSWLDEVRPLMSPEAFSRWDDVRTEGSPGSAWLWAHDQRVKVEVSVKCVTNPELGPPKPDMMGLRCSATDIPVYADGTRVPPSALDFTWVYTGVRPPYILSVVNRDGSWIIGADATGIAS